MFIIAAVVSDGREPSGQSPIFGVYQSRVIAKLLEDICHEYLPTYRGGM
jgi:hypothetical protein